MKFLLPQKQPSLDVKQIEMPDATTVQNHRKLPKKEYNRSEDFPHYKKVSNYLLGSVIGEGSFAKVRVGLHIPTKQKVAIKIVNKQKARQDSYMYMNLHREGRLLQMIRHPNVVQILDILETANNYYLITELITGGELIDIVTKKGSLPEETVQKYVKQLVDAVAYIHKKKIVHRDLKIENILLDGEENMKVIDFGLSNVASSSHSDISESLVTQCGSPAYAAPELLSNQNYGPKVDVWSIGVIAFSLLVGKLPFSVEPFNLTTLCKKMMRGERNSITKIVSPQFRSFIEKLLNPDQEKRPSIEEVKNLEWLNNPEFCVGNTANELLNPKNSDCANPTGKQESPRFRPAPSHVDASMLKEMKEKFGYEFSEVIRSVRRNRPGSVLATYHLLKSTNSNKFRNEQKQNSKVSQPEQTLRLQKSKSSNPSTVNIKTNSTNQKVNLSSKPQQFASRDESQLNSKTKAEDLKYLELSSDPEGKQTTVSEEPETNSYPSHKPSEAFKQEKGNGKLSQISTEIKQQLSKKFLIIRESNSPAHPNKQKSTSFALIFSRPQFCNKDIPTKLVHVHKPSTDRKITKTHKKQIIEHTKKLDDAESQLGAAKCCKSLQESKQDEEKTQGVAQDRISSPKCPKPKTLELQAAHSKEEICRKSHLSSIQPKIPPIFGNYPFIKTPREVKVETKVSKRLTSEKSPTKTRFPFLSKSADTKNQHQSEDQRNTQVDRHQMQQSKRSSLQKKRLTPPPVLLSRRFQKIYWDNSTQFFDNRKQKWQEKDSFPKITPKRIISEPIAAAILSLVASRTAQG